MSVYSGYMYEQFSQAILGWDDEISSDIYALSVLTVFEDDNPCRPQALLSYNTTSHWNSQVSQASDSDEAKWNFAYWSQDFKAIIATTTGEGYVDPDLVGIALRDTWLRDLGLCQSEDQYESDDGLTDACGEFVKVCVAVDRRLHDDGVISAKFGHPIPILVHEFEYNDEIAAQARSANPPGVAQEFEDWIAQIDARSAAAGFAVEHIEPAPPNKPIPL